MKRGFTLIEMLVVVGIISILVAASIMGFSKMSSSAERTKLNELVSQVATALTQVYNSNGAWPKTLREASQGDGRVDEKVAYYLAKRNLISATYDTSSNSDKKTTGFDRFGVVTPWATAAIKSRGSAASLSTKVIGGSGTVQDHILRFRIDYDGDGIIPDVPVGGGSVAVRATAVVWSCGKDGKFETYEKGLRSDDVYSWGPGQTKNVK